MDDINKSGSPKQAILDLEPFTSVYGLDVRVTFYQWLVADGEAVVLGQPIIELTKMSKGDIISAKYKIKNSISDGILAHSSIKSGDILSGGRLLFYIYEEGEYENENSVANEEYKLYTSIYRLKKDELIHASNIFPKLASSRNSISSFKVIAIKEDGQLVHKNEHIITIKNFIGQEAYDIVSPRDGYINYSKHGNGLQQFNADQLLCTISSSDQNRIDQKYSNKPSILLDEFSGHKKIKWDVVGGFNRYIWSLDTSDSVSLGISFHFDEGDYIVFGYSTKELTLAKNDKISFLFENGSIIDFTLNQNSYRSTDQVHKVFENRVPISDDELLLFAKENFKLWKIRLDKTGREVIGGTNGIGNYQASSNLKIVFKKVANEYRSLVRQEIIDYTPFSRAMESPSIADNRVSDVCYVYLMNDTINNIHKIGISNNPNWREKTLQSEKPTIELLVAKKFINRRIAASLERALHDAYSEKRIRGEWFKLDSSELSEIIETLTN